MPRQKKTNYSALRLLGKNSAGYPSAPSAATLDTFENRFQSREYWVRFCCPEFTSVCPVTGQPDFARITIDYAPADLCIETKSLKFYLASFRNTRSFNEEIVNRILDDLVVSCKPRRLLVRGAFVPRGGIALSVEAAFPSDEAIPGHRWLQPPA